MNSNSVAVCMDSVCNELAKVSQNVVEAGEQVESL